MPTFKHLTTVLLTLALLLPTIGESVFWPSTTGHSEVLMIADTGIPDETENCVNIADPDQSDRDTDGVGDACNPIPPVDQYTDVDGISDAEDATPNEDTNDVGFDESVDNCLTVGNPDQLHSDDNGIGEACDTPPTTEIDGDGIPGELDNCPEIANAYNEDCAIAPLDIPDEESNPVVAADDSEEPGTVVVTWYDQDGNIIPDTMCLWIMPLDDPEQSGSQACAVDGVTTYTNIPPGRYRTEYWAPPGYRPGPDFPWEIFVTAGETTYTDITYDLDLDTDYSRLIIHVLDSSGTPISNLCIAEFRPDW